MNWVRRVDERNLLYTKLGISYTRRRQESHFAGSGSQILAPLERNTGTGTTDAGITFSGKDANSVLAGHIIVVGWDAAHWRRRESRRQGDATDE